VAVGGREVALGSEVASTEVGEAAGGMVGEDTWTQPVTKQIIRKNSPKKNAT
jgi:hypothetical protein